MFGSVALKGIDYFTWLHTRARKYNLSSLGTYSECKGVKRTYLVTMETFVVQRSRSTPPSMVYTTFKNELDLKEMEAK